MQTFANVLGQKIVCNARVNSFKHTKNCIVCIAQNFKMADITDYNILTVGDTKVYST